MSETTTKRVIASEAKQSSATKKSLDRHADKSARDDVTVKASLKELRMTPRKVGEVIALIRNRSVDDALVILAHTPRRAAKPVVKLIESARANATNNHGLKTDGLRIETISVTAGPRLKRYKPVARGMAHPFQKRTSNIYVVLSGNVKPNKTKNKSHEVRDMSYEKAAKTDTHNSELITHNSAEPKGGK